MVWYSLLAALGLLFVLSVSLPVPRRIWALAIYSVKYGLLWLTDVVGLRKLYLAATGRGAKYQRRRSSISCGGTPNSTIPQSCSCRTTLLWYRRCAPVF